jgi:hypothetical protein
MNQSFVRRVGMTAIVMAALAGAGVALAQTAPPPPQPVVIVGNTQFTTLFDGVVLMPVEKAEQDLDVGGFARVSLLAVADADLAASGRVGIAEVFGPPAVPVDNRLVLPFNGGTHAKGSATHPVMGPHLRVGLVNNSSQMVTVTLSVYAAK